jgi:hypothetical protein
MRFIKNGWLSKATRLKGVKSNLYVFGGVGDFYPLFL